MTQNVLATLLEDLWTKCGESIKNIETKTCTAKSKQGEKNKQAQQKKTTKQNRTVSEHSSTSTIYMLSFHQFDFCVCVCGQSAGSLSKTWKQKHTQQNQNNERREEQHAQQKKITKQNRTVGEHTSTSTIDMLCFHQFDFCCLF